MPIAELVLDSSPNDFESFYFKATDQSTSLVVLVASKNQIARLLENAGDAPGLYVLQADDSTVYVGQSKVLGERLRTHKTNNKIGYRRVMVMLRDQSLSRYLDYGEAKLFETLKSLGYRLEQSSLTGSLESKRQRLMSLDKEHVAMADALVQQFLAYSVALGLTRPATVPTESTTQSAPVNVPVVPVCKAPAPSTTAPAAQGGVRLSNLWMQRSDHTVLRAESGVAVLVQALSEAKLARVESLGLRLSGEPLVSRVRSSKYPAASHAVPEGWFVMSHSSSADKAKILRKVSEALGLGWTVHLASDARGSPAPAT